MKKIKGILLSAWPGIAMLLLILDARTGLAGAGEAVELCIRTVIPSLFPFLFLSILFTQSILTLPLPWMRPIGMLCRIPKGSEGLLAIGLLGGYPVGAQCVAQAYAKGNLTEETAERMLGFCNNPGPAFLFGILSGSFSDIKTIWVLWGIQIFSAIFTGILLPGGSYRTVQHCKDKNVSVSQALNAAIKALASICGWVMIFRVILAFFRNWIFWLLPVELEVLISGLLELTNGCCTLSLIENESTRFLLTSVMLSFGGICVFLQTISVTQGLDISAYIPGKLLQTLISYILATLTAPLLFPGSNFHPYTLHLLILIASVWILLKFFKDHSSFLRKQRV